MFDVNFWMPRVTRRYLDKGPVPVLPKGCTYGLVVTEADSFGPVAGYAWIADSNGRLHYWDL